MNSGPLGYSVWFIIGISVSLVYWHIGALSGWLLILSGITKIFSWAEFGVFASEMFPDRSSGPWLCSFGKSMFSEISPSVCRSWNRTRGCIIQRSRQRYTCWSIRSFSFRGSEGILIGYIMILHLIKKMKYIICSGGMNIIQLESRAELYRSGLKGVIKGNINTFNNGLWID